MPTIAEIREFPNETKVAEVSGTLVNVYERRAVRGPSGSVQNGTLKDSSGAEIEIAVWGHQDITPLKGKEVVVTDAQGGMKRKDDTYQGKTKRVLSLNRSSVFQVLDSGGAKSVPSTMTATAQPATPRATVVSGQTIGMAINNAAADYQTAGEFADEEKIFQRASMYIRVSQRMDKGEIYHPKPVDGPNPF